jgi:hypothetical protein
MNLTIDEKQFIRSVADLVLNNRKLAKNFFSRDDIANMDLFSSISEIITYVQSVDSVDLSDEQYRIEIERLINKITSKDIKDVFLTSFSNLSIN